MTKIASLFDHINHIIGRILIWLCLVLVLLMFINVIQRYFFATNHIWQTELILALHALSFLALAGYGLKYDRHIRVDIFYEKFCPSKKAWVNSVGTLFFLIPSAVGILYFSYDFIDNSWRISEASREAGGLQGIYLIKSFIALFSISLLLQSVVILSENIRKIVQRTH